MATITFDGASLGDICSNVSVEVHAGRAAEIQTAVKRTTAMLSNESPNRYYLLRCQVHKKGTSMLNAAAWAAGLGEDVIVAGLKTVTVTEGAETLTMTNAALRSPVAPPNREETNAALVRGLELVFVSADKPTVA